MSPTRRLRARVNGYQVESPRFEKQGCSNSRLNLVSEVACFKPCRSAGAGRDIALDSICRFPVSQGGGGHGVHHGGSQSFDFCFPFLAYPKINIFIHALQRHPPFHLPFFTYSAFSKALRMSSSRVKCA